MSLTQRYVLTSPVAHARRSDAMVVRFSDSASLGEDGVSPALLLGVGWDDGLVTVHRAASGALLHSVVADAAAAEAAGAPHTSRGGLPVTCLRWRPHSQTPVLLAGGSDGTLRHIDGATGAAIGASVVEVKNEIHSLDVRGDGGAFATGGKDGAVRVYDEETREMVVKLTGNVSVGAEHFHDSILSSSLERRGKVLDRFEAVSGRGPRITGAGGGHNNRVYAVAWHPSCWGRTAGDGSGSSGQFADPRQENIVASGSVDNTVNVWDVRLGGSVRSFCDCHIAGDGLGFSADGRFMFTASLRSQEQLQVWDWVSGKLVCDIPWTGSSREAALHLASQHADIQERFTAAQAATGAEEALHGGGGGGRMASREGPVGSSLYSLALSRSANPVRPDAGDAWESAFLLTAGSSVHEAKIFCLSSVFSAVGAHGLLPRPKESGTLWASAMYRVRRRASIVGGEFKSPPSAKPSGADAVLARGPHAALFANLPTAALAAAHTVTRAAVRAVTHAAAQAATLAVAHTAAHAAAGARAPAAAGGGGGGGDGGSGDPRVGDDEVDHGGEKPHHHLSFTPCALRPEPEGFKVPKGHFPSPLVGTVRGFPRALYSVHWAPGGQGFAVASGDGAYVLDLHTGGGGAGWVASNKADLVCEVRPPEKK